MRLLTTAAVLCAVIAVPATVIAHGPDAASQLERPAESATNQSNFCEGTYALCITAPCTPIPTLDRLANYYVEHALCECDVVTGWSMGPGSCRDRAPVTPPGQSRTFLISTYSNAYNGKVGEVDNKVLTCGDDTQWAWCYGAPCVVSEEDPTKAQCTCPVVTGAAGLLGDCDSGMCDQIWSAAVPPGDCFANWNYFTWMTENGFETRPPARTCASGETLCPRPQDLGGGD